MILVALKEKPGTKKERTEQKKTPYIILQLLHAWTWMFTSAHKHAHTTSHARTHNHVACIHGRGLVRLYCCREILHLLILFKSKGDDEPNASSIFEGKEWGLEIVSATYEFYWSQLKIEVGSPSSRRRAMSHPFKTKYQQWPCKWQTSNHRQWESRSLSI